MDVCWKVKNCSKVLCQKRFRFKKLINDIFIMSRLRSLILLTQLKLNIFKKDNLDLFKHTFWIFSLSPSNFLFIQICFFSSQKAVTCPSHFCRVKITSPSSQSHLKFFRVQSESRHKNCRRVTQSYWLESSSQMKFNIFPCLSFSTKWRSAS